MCTGAGQDGPEASKCSEWGRPWEAEGDCQQWWQEGLTSHKGQIGCLCGRLGLVNSIVRACTFSVINSQMCDSPMYSSNHCSNHADECSIICKLLATLWWVLASRKSCAITRNPHTYTSSTAGTYLGCPSLTYTHIKLKDSRIRSCPLSAATVGSDPYSPQHVRAARNSHVPIQCKWSAMLHCLFAVCTVIRWVKTRRDVLPSTWPSSVSSPS